MATEASGAPRQGRAIILLDLDETLVVQSTRCGELQYDDVIRHSDQHQDYLRPGAIEFLERLAARAHLALVTNKPHPYSDRVHAHLCARSPSIAAALGSVHEHELNRMRPSNEVWVSKCFNAIFCDVEDARRSILIDDDSNYVHSNIGHAIPALQRSDYVRDWNEGLLGRILPLVEGALDAFEGSAAQRELMARPVPVPVPVSPGTHAPVSKRERHGDEGKAAEEREDGYAEEEWSGHEEELPSKTRAWLECASQRHDFNVADFYLDSAVHCTCAGRKARHEHARRIFSGEAVHNERVCARLHACMHSTHPCFEQSEIGRDDPIARYLIAHAYGDNYEGHERALLQAREDKAAEQRAVQAEHDALPDEQAKSSFRRSERYWIINRRNVDYELDGVQYTVCEIPGSFHKFGLPSY